MSYADFTVDRSEDRLQSLTDRLRDIRSSYVMDLQAMQLTTALMSDVELEFDAFAEAVKHIAVQELDIASSAVAEEGERVAVKVERMLVLK